MTIKEYVDNVLCVPVTRIGNKYITTAIELVVDTKEHKFYHQLSDMLQVSPSRIEKATREAKNLSLLSLDDQTREKIFGSSTPTVTEYVIKAAEYYRRTYENKKE